IRGTEAPQAVARVMGASHTNPLETLIIVVAGSLTLSLLGAAFAFRTIKTTLTKTEQQQAMTDALSKLADATIQNLKRGERPNVDSAIKFARVLIEASPKALSEKLKLMVSPAKLTLETATATPGGRSGAGRSEGKS